MGNKRKFKEVFIMLVYIQENGQPKKTEDDLKRTVSIVFPIFCFIVQ